MVTGFDRPNLSFSVQRMPDERRDMAANFEQDVIRWYYEGRKVEFAKAQIDLMRVEPSTMQPYPCDLPLATQLSGARHVQSGNPAFTGRFSAVSVD